MAFNEHNRSRQRTERKNNTAYSEEGIKSLLFILYEQQKKDNATKHAPLIAAAKQGNRVFPTYVKTEEFKDAYRTLANIVIAQNGLHEQVKLGFSGRIHADMGFALFSAFLAGDASGALVLDEDRTLLFHQRLLESEIGRTVTPVRNYFHSNEIQK
jgi:hypothetical protein